MDDSDMNSPADFHSFIFRTHRTMLQRIIKYGGLDDDPIYSCVNMTVPYEKLATSQAPYFGVGYILYGFLVQTCYFLTLPIFLEKEFLQMSCYKIMLAMGIIDSTVVIVSCEITGYFMIVGSTFCMYPKLTMFGGAVAVISYNTVCCLCLFLVFNRILDFWKPHIGEMIFRGKRAWIFVVVAIMYGMAFIVTPYILFNADYGTWIYDPLIPGNTFHDYNSIPQSIHNACIVGGICVLYTILFILYAVKIDRLDMDSANKRSLQGKLLLQATLVCVFTFATSAIWSSMLFIPPTHTLMHIGHASWQLMHGTPAFVYLLINKTIRTRVVSTYFPCLARKHIVTYQGSQAHSTSRPPSSAGKRGGGTTTATDVKIEA